MIILFSESDDSSTTEVMKWLRSFNVKNLRRINEDEQTFQYALKLYSEKTTEVVLFLNKEYIPLHDITMIWFRRAHYNAIKKNIKYEVDAFSEFKENLRYFLIKENNILREVLWERINKIQRIGNPIFQNLNKIIVLEEAKLLGIKIPNTYINHEKEFINEVCITKALSDGPNWNAKDYMLNFKTYLLDNEKYLNINEHFFPTLIQEKIDKLFEIRTFYLKGNFYSMAIFSQENEKTKIDFRNYDKFNPNRNVPFKLPVLEEKKLEKLMKKMDLNTGSIDIIYSKNHEYIFLEINPVGQYDMVSYPCNYYLHKIIAEHLSSKT